jgi:hypothetical protein
MNTALLSGSGWNETSHDQHSQSSLSCIGQFVKLSDGDMDRISGFHLADLITDLHTALTALDVVNLLHGVHMADENFTGGDKGMGEKHQGLKMPGVQNHVSDAAPVGPVASGFHLRVFQVALYHGFVLSDNSSFIRNILIKNGCGNQNKISQCGKKGMLEYKSPLGYEQS